MAVERVTPPALPGAPPARRSFLKLAWLGLGLAALGEAAWIVTSFLKPRKETPKDAGSLVVASCPLHLAREAFRGPAPKSAVTAETTFVGRKDCARCHEKETNAWTGLHHDQAMTEATEATVRGDFWLL